MSECRHGMYTLLLLTSGHMFGLFSWNEVLSFSVVPLHQSPLSSPKSSSFRVALDAKKKGFGDINSKSISSKKTKSAPNKGSDDNNTVISTETTSTKATTFASSSSALNSVETVRNTGVTSSAETSSSAQKLNAGQMALEKLRRERAEQRDAELRKVREMLQADEQVSSTPAAIPEKVAMRMGQRMIPFVGVPFFLGLSTFVGFWYMATYRDLEFQPALVAASTIILLLVGLVGITYSVMSASWDTDREGSFFGFDEFQKNVKNIQQGFSRSRENAILRDKMKGLSEDEIQKALKDLEQRDRKQQQENVKKSFQTKLKDEL